MAGLSERMLSQTLKDLEADGFVLRTAHAVVPPHVDYELTDLGKEATWELLLTGIGYFSVASNGQGRKHRPE